MYPTHPKSNRIATNRYQPVPWLPLPAAFLPPRHPRSHPTLGGCGEGGYIWCIPTENKSWQCLEKWTRNEDVIISYWTWEIFHSHVSFQECTSSGNEAMPTAKWQITLLTIVVTHQIHSNSALFKNNAFEPIWWIQSCSNRSTAGKILWENGVVPPDGNVMVMFRPDILSLLKQHLLYKVKCCQIAKHIFDVLMFQHLSIQIWLTSAGIWHILTICISLKHKKKP